MKPTTAGARYAEIVCLDSAFSYGWSCFVLGIHAAPSSFTAMEKEAWARGYNTNAICNERHLPEEPRRAVE